MPYSHANFSFKLLSLYKTIFITFNKLLQKNHKHKFFHYDIVHNI